MSKKTRIDVFTYLFIAISMFYLGYSTRDIMPEKLDHEKAFLNNLSARINIINKEQGSEKTKYSCSSQYIMGVAIGTIYTQELVEKYGLEICGDEYKEFARDK